MINRSEVLTREDNRISLVYIGGTAMQRGYLTITERELQLNTTEQSWIFELAEETPVGRTTPRLVNTLVKIIEWLGNVGSGKVNDSHLESRHNIQHNFRMNGIGR